MKTRVGGYREGARDSQRHTALALRPSITSNLRKPTFHRSDCLSKQFFIVTSFTIWMTVGALSVVNVNKSATSCQLSPLTFNNCKIFQRQGFKQIDDTQVRELTRQSYGSGQIIASSTSLMTRTLRNLRAHSPVADGHVRNYQPRMDMPNWDLLGNQLLVSVPKFLLINRYHLKTKWDGYMVWRNVSSQPLQRNFVELVNQVIFMQSL